MFETSGDLNRYVVREKLIGQRIVAGLVTLLFGGIAAAMVLYYDDRDAFFWIFGTLVALSGIGSFHFLLTAPETETTIDALERKVTLKRRSLVGEKSEEYSFDELDGEAYVKTTNGTRGDVFSQLLLPRQFGEPVPLTTASRYNANRDLKPIAESINEIIFPHQTLPFEVTILDDE